MSDIETRVIRLLHDMATESRPVALGPLRHVDATHRRRQRITAAMATAAVITAVIGSLMLAGARRSATPEPAQQPPPELRLSSTSSTRPGVSLMAVTLSGGEGHAEPVPAYVVQAGDDAAVAVPPPSSGSYLPQQVLSTDGRLLLRFESEAGGTGTLTNLVSGHEQELPDIRGYAALSPDNHTIAIRDYARVTLVDVASGATRTLRRQRDPGPEVGRIVGAQVGWSPDGRLLGVQDGNDVLVLTRSGREQAHLTGQSLVNGNLSWSPGGDQLLTYDRVRSVFLVTPADGGDGQALRSPPDALRALGWTGDRVVWLAGQPGTQSLLTTDDRGNEPRTWMRLAVGNRPVYSVTWSQALTG